jgi:tetratricopeptide (TPR) repeat protein
LARLTREAAETLERGLRYCRKDDWNAGLLLLGRLAEADPRWDLPGHFYSFLGYAVARCKGRRDEGLKLCQHAIRLEFYQPDNFLNLARVHLLGKERKEAVTAVRQGLGIDPGHTGLRVLARELGVRRPPVVTFLSRNHPINRLLGWLRHRYGKGGG